MLTASGSPKPRIPTSAAVHGPIPGTPAMPRTRRPGPAPRPRGRPPPRPGVPAAPPPGTRPGPAPPAGAPVPAGGTRGKADPRGPRDPAGAAARSRRCRLAVAGDQPPVGAAGLGAGHLLLEDRGDQRLDHRAGSPDPQAAHLAHRRGDRIMARDERAGIVVEAQERLQARQRPGGAGTPGARPRAAVAELHEQRHRPVRGPGGAPGAARSLEPECRIVRCRAGGCRGSGAGRAARPPVGTARRRVPGRGGDRSPDAAYRPLSPPRVAAPGRRPESGRVTPSGASSPGESQPRPIPPLPRRDPAAPVPRRGPDLTGAGRLRGHRANQAHRRVRGTHGRVRPGRRTWTSGLAPTELRPDDRPGHVDGRVHRSARRFNGDVDSTDRPRAGLRRKAGVGRGVPAIPAQAASRPLVPTSPSPRPGSASSGRTTGASTRTSAGMGRASTAAGRPAGSATRRRSWASPIAACPAAPS